MISARVDISVFTEKIREYQKLTGKALGDVVKEQARLLAERLTKLTYPNTNAQGRKRVAIDVGKVYLGSKWFEEVFTFKNQHLQDRVKSAVLGRDASTLEAIFDRSPRLQRIHIETFDASRHAKLRWNGRVLVPNPYSFPLGQQGAVNAYLRQRQKNVGTAKAGWAQCTAQLGKSVPAWLNKPESGGVTDESRRADNPYIVLSNKVSFFPTLDRKANIVSRALAGRGRDMIKSAERQLREAAKQAKLN